MRDNIKIRNVEISLLLTGIVFAALSLGIVAGQERDHNAEDLANDLNAGANNHAAENQRPTLINLQPDEKSPSIAGATIEWSALASDPDGDVLLFQFWLNGPATGNAWRAITNWTGESIWNWTTTSKDVGNNIIEVWVRDGQHATPDEWDDKLSSEYQIDVKENQKPTVSSLRPDKVSPQPQGARIVWTALASDPNGDTLLYKWYLKGPSTDDVLVPMSEWTTKNQWAWRSSSSATGMYSIEVWVRDGYHTGPEGYDDFQRESFVIRQFVP